jgi:hypothetical protein
MGDKMNKKKKTAEASWERMERLRVDGFPQKAQP